MNNVITLPTSKKPQTLKIKPFSVLVHWSESREFEEDQLLDFESFEKRALNVALTNDRGGYDKTKVTVTFENGDTYTARLDLGCNNDLNFAHHCYLTIKFALEKLTADPVDFKNHFSHMVPMINEMKSFDLDFSEVESSIKLEQKAIEEAKADERQKAKKEKDEKAAFFRDEVLRLRESAEYSHLKQGAQSAVDVAKNMRADVKKHFPGVKFSVRKSSHNCINISWTDGPTQDEADQILQRYQSGDFNGYTDCYDFSRSPFNNVFGDVMYVFTSRDHSDESKQQAINAVKAEFKSVQSDHVTIEAFQKGELYNTTPVNNGSLNSHSWESLIYSKLRKNSHIEKTEVYDPSNQYDFNNSIVGIKQLALDFGIEVLNVDQDALDFENNGNCGAVTLRKNNKTIIFQVFGDGKMAVFSEAGERLESFGRYSFFSLYSNDGDTLKERLQAFDLGTTPEAPEEKKQAPAVIPAEEPAQMVQKCKPIQKTTHSQKGHDLFVVQLVERTTRDQFLELCEIAKSQGGYYSKYTKDGAINGFQFLSETAARAFIMLLGNEDQPMEESKPKVSAEKSGAFWAVKITTNKRKRRYNIEAKNKIEAMRAAYAEFLNEETNDDPEPTPPTPPKTAKKAPLNKIKSYGDKLRAQAQKMSEKAETELNAPRQENTHRRAGMAATARNRARKEIAHANLLNNIASEQDKGTAGALAGIKTKAHLFTLSTVFMGAIPSEFSERTAPDCFFNTPLERIKSGAVLSDFIDQVTIKDFYKTSLKNAGINTDEELKNALVKYEELSTDAPKECPIKAAERQLIGVKIDGYFPTPEAVRAVMIETAQLKEGFKVLEPEAGAGALADDLRSAGCVVDCCEISHSLREILTAKNHNIIEYDFLNLSKFGNYDRVIMNPPFEKGQDIDHVMHAFKMLKPGGLLVSVMGAGVEFNSNKKFVAFREWLADNGGTMEKLPANSFKTGDRSTGVNTVLISLIAPIETTAPDTEEKSEEPATRADLSLGDHEQRTEEKRERASERAHKATAKSNQYYQQSKSLADAIPFGQPILIGHHSEKRSRRDADRIYNDMGKSVAESKKADYHANKAQTIGSAGIASDDSEAITKLKQKIRRLELSQNLMKLVNKVIKKHKDHDQRLKALLDAGTNEEDAIKLLEPDFMGRFGFQSYTISNNGANLRTTKKRLEEVQALHNSAPINESGEGWAMSEKDGRICAFFDDKPCDEVRAICKSHGFTWSPTRGAWVRKITANATHGAQALADKLKQYHADTVPA